MKTSRIRLAAVAPLTLGVMLAAHAATSGASDSSAVDQGSPIVAALDAVARQPAVAYTAHRRLEGALVDKDEQAWMEVETEFTPGRGISHRIVAEGGSNRIRQRALKRVLEAEAETSRGEEARRAALSSENYRYRLIGTPTEDARIELMPRRQDVRLLKGLAVVGTDDGALRRVEGQLAENPSFWVRDVHVQRTYAQVGGATLPVAFESSAHVRMFGEARLRITIDYATVDGVAIQ